MRTLHDAPIAADGEYVLYWMTAFRRAHDNFALQHAIRHAEELDRPLIVLEPLRAGYRWASDRHHRFVIDGMRDNRADFEERGVAYFPYVEPEPGAGSGLLAELARDACLVVADDSPTFFLPRMVAAAASKLGARLEAVDSNGLVPLAATDRVFARAHDFRRFAHRVLIDHLEESPLRDPLDGAALPDACALPSRVTKRWAPADAILAADSDLGGLPIDHDVAPSPILGGAHLARQRAERFVRERIEQYATARNDPNSGSGLSPYLHFGHLSPHTVARAIFEQEDWNPDRIDESRVGCREGWWGLSEAGESFLDELMTWRELGHHFCAKAESYEDYDSLPEWARRTLDEHASDPRDPVYTLEQFENAETHDEIWNAAQRQLRGEGVIANYLRMLWGKKVLHWSRTPREAYEILVELNNKYSIDGRDPNSYSGIAWTFGRFDRAWGPERPIFGKIRYMTSDSTRRKIKLDTYLARWGPSLFEDLPAVRG